MNRWILFAMLCLLLPSGSATAEPWQIEAQIVKMPASSLGQARILEAGDWQEKLRSGQVQVLDVGSHSGTLDSDSLGHVGAKVPILYADPRAGSYQVQYIDAGFKVEARAVKVPGDRVRVECRVEHGALAPDAVSEYRQNMLVVNSILLLRPGQVGILCSTHGLLTARYLKQTYPEATFGPDDAVLIAVSVPRS